MKKNTIFVLVLGMMCNLSTDVYAKNKPQADKQPEATLDETLDFIDRKLGENVTINRFEQKLSWQRGDGCSSLKNLAKVRAEGSKIVTHIDEFSLRDINLTKIHIGGEAESLWGISIFADTFGKKVHEFMTVTESASKSADFSTRFDKEGTAIHFNDINIANRVMNAFKHAVLLCQNNGKEPF